MVYAAPLLPDQVGQSCSTTVSVVASVAGAVPLTDVRDNPLSESQNVTFVPGRLPPTVSVGWDGWDCAAPAEGVAVTIAVDGQSTSYPEQTTGCDDPGDPPGSFLEPASAPPDSTVSIAPTPDGEGLVTANQLGGLTGYGDAPELLGSYAEVPTVAVASLADGSGGWEVDAAGGVTAFGDAPFWLLGADDGLFAYGDATPYGSFPNPDGSQLSVIG